MFVYINYPNPHIRIHKNRRCTNIQKMDKVDQRRIRINVDNVAQELQKFDDKEYRFGANKELNDMWIEIDLRNDPLETALVQKLQDIIGHHYRPLRDCGIDTHC
jgi:hypothetical protein